MSEEIHGDPAAIAKLASDLLVVANAYDDDVRAAQASMWLPQGACGNTDSAPTLEARHDRCRETGGMVADRTRSVLENDVDDLYGTAFAYKQADEDAARCVADTTSHQRGPRWRRGTDGGETCSLGEG